MNFHPNANYFKVKITLLRGEHVLIFCKNKSEWYYLDENIEVPEFYLTEKQYYQNLEKLIQIHLSVALRKKYATWELGHESAKLNEDGEVDDESWEWIPGHLEPKDFQVLTVPYYTKKIECYKTDTDGNLYPINA